MGWAGPDNWARPRKRWVKLGLKAKLDPKYYFFNSRDGLDPARQLVWARTGPARSNLFTGSLVTKLDEIVQREL